TSRRDAKKLEAHIEECRPCASIYLELREVNSDLAGILAPLVLGGLATGYLAAAGTGAASAGAFSLLAGRIRDVVLGNAGVSAAAGVAGVVVTGAAVAAIVTALPENTSSTMGQPPVGNVLPASPTVEGPEPVAGVDDDTDDDG